MVKPSQKVEKSRFDAQLDAERWQAVEGFIRANQPLFYVSGYVTSDWRARNGRRFGPYFRLRYRQGNTQRSIYLVPSPELAEKVRRLLAELQFRRTCRRLTRNIRASLRLEKKNLQNMLRACGYRMKGFEIHKARLKTKQRAQPQTPRPQTG